MDFLAVYNATDEEVTTTINGSFFTWKPGQIKQMRAGQANFVDTNRKELGLVVIRDPRFIPAEQDSYVPSFEKTKEGQDVLAPLKEQGINNFVESLVWIIRNNQVSLRQDMASKWPTGDAAKMAAAGASNGELNAMRLVAKYKKKTKDNAARQVEEIEKLMQEIGPISN